MAKDKSLMVDAESLGQNASAFGVLRFVPILAENNQLVRATNDCGGPMFTQGCLDLIQIDAQTIYLGDALAASDDGEKPVSIQGTQITGVKHSPELVAAIS